LAWPLQVTSFSPAYPRTKCVPATGAVVVEAGLIQVSEPRAPQTGLAKAVVGSG
jgi:hypothetical protein